MSDPCRLRFTTWIDQKIGGAMLGEVVVASEYDTALSQLAALREELEKYKDGFFQQVTDEDLKKISDFVGDGDLPTQSFFMRPDSANLANMTMHMVREVQSMRVRLADAERRNVTMTGAMERVQFRLRSFVDDGRDMPLESVTVTCDIALKALSPKPEAASHE